MLHTLPSPQQSERRLGLLRSSRGDLSNRLSCVFVIAVLNVYLCVCVQVYGTVWYTTSVCVGAWQSGKTSVPAMRHLKALSAGQGFHSPSQCSSLEDTVLLILQCEHFFALRHRASHARHWFRPSHFQPTHHDPDPNCLEIADAGQGCTGSGSLNR
jgi:hypothetical protein